MKLKEISKKHYIVVDDSEIKQGDFVYSSDGGIFKRHIDNPCQAVFSISKITHSTQPIEYEVVDVTPTGDAIEGYVYDKIQELSLSEVKALLGEVDVEQYAWDNPVLSRKDVYELFNDVFKDRIIEGAYRISASKQVYRFNTKLRELAKQKALEDNKEKKWTDEDVIRIVEKSRQTGLTAEYILLTLQPKTEWNVEIIDGMLKLKQ